MTRQVTDELDGLVPFVRTEAIDELALRLTGLSGDAFVRECSQLMQAILFEMLAEGEVGAVEIAVVLATLKAAVIKASRMQVGHA